jgi:hypothetical protein
MIQDCSHFFNPNCVTLRNDKNKTKSQPTQTFSRKHIRTQPVHTDSTVNQDVYTTDDSESESESESEQLTKQQKN